MKAATFPFGVYNRRFPIGAEPVTGGACFRVWAPQAKRVELLIGADQRSQPTELKAEAHGYYSGFVPGCAAGDLYRFRLDGQEQLLPDPASRFQPEGPFGPSVVVDPDRFEWTDDRWAGLPPEGNVIYEMHIGTFTP